MNRYILSPGDSELFDLLDNWLALSWAITHWRTSQKQTLAKPARNNLTTQSVPNLATQPEKQPGDTARKTTWRHSQKNNLAIQPEKQPGDTARKTTWRHSQKNDPHLTWRVGSTQWAGGHLHWESAIEWRPSTNWLPSAPDSKPPPLNKLKL